MDIDGVSCLILSLLHTLELAGAGAGVILKAKHLSFTGTTCVGELEIVTVKIFMFQSFTNAILPVVWNPH